MKAISLFSGAGGDSWGLKEAGIDVVGFVELDETAIGTHKKMMPNCELIGKDITTIPDEVFKKWEGKVDIIFGGFPPHFQFEGNRIKQINQIGNAVPPPIAKEIGLQLLEISK